MSLIKKAINEVSKAREMLALLNTSQGDKFADSEFIDNLYANYISRQETLKKIVIERRSDEDEDGVLSREVLDTMLSIDEWTNLLEIMSSKSTKDRKQAQEKIDELDRKLNQLIFYSPKSYFNTYFYTNTTGIKEDKHNLFDKFIDKSSNFKNWFANSVTTDPDGEPIVFYHGSKRDEFVRFDFDLFPGMYFAENKEYTEYFSGTEGRVYEVYLRVFNPIDLRLFAVDKIGYDEFVGYIELKYGFVLPESKMMRALSQAENGIEVWRYLRMSPDWLKYISKGGLFDGIWFFENNPDHLIRKKQAITPAMMVFRPEQIKSAKGNLTFSISSKDIRFNKGGNLDSLSAFNRWRESPAFNSAIRELNEQDVDYDNWSDTDIWKWWKKNDTE
jgi:hypothetical protein